MIKEIEISGYGGFDRRSFSLSPIQLVTGPNGSGKTALLDAVSLGLIGYCPWLGNKPALTRGRMSAAAASIRLKMETGTSSIMFPKTGAPIIKKEGSIPEVDPMVIDIAKFFSMTGPQKIRFLLGISTVKVPTEDEVRKTMWESTVSQHGLDITEWSKKVDPMFAKVKGDKSTLEWLTELIAAATDMKQMGAGLPALRETAQRLEAEAATKDGLPPVDVSVDLENARLEETKARGKVAELRGELNAINGQIRVATETENRANKLMVDIPDKKCPTCGGTIRGEVRADHVKQANAAAAKQAADMMLQLRSRVVEIQKKIDQANQEVGVIEMRVAGIRANQDRFLAFKGKVTQLDTIRLQILEIEDTVSVFSGIPNWITKYQASLLDGNMQHVCSIASKIFGMRFGGSVIIREGKFFVVNEKGDEISLDCASGGQRLLATIGIQVALMQSSAFKIVLVDEMGTADEDSVQAILDVLAELKKEGVIDQFIGAGPSLAWVETAAVIDLGEAA